MNINKKLLKDWIGKKAKNYGYATLWVTNYDDPNIRFSKSLKEAIMYFDERCIIIDIRLKKLVLVGELVQ